MNSLGEFYRVAAFQLMRRMALRASKRSEPMPPMIFTVTVEDIGSSDPYGITLGQSLCESFTEAIVDKEIDPIDFLEHMADTAETTEGWRHAKLWGWMTMVELATPSEPERTQARLWLVSNPVLGVVSLAQVTDKRIKAIQLSHSRMEQAMRRLAVATVLPLEGRVDAN